MPEYAQRTEKKIIEYEREICINNVCRNLKIFTKSLKAWPN